ncbi:hypothetical protein H4219_005197 [Mycoemilia scoparia]|uniref:Uncharacterized protein n=1 Tax=Mycoemilia scoparia TaxID=417184 RepID=A0A9W8DKA6_9FUNG|nr:hypothetical protein H4219_005197 [Mycoemilia scoparia]
MQGTASQIINRIISFFRQVTQGGKKLSVEEIKQIENDLASLSNTFSNKLKNCEGFGVKSLQHVIENISMAAQNLKDNTTLKKIPYRGQKATLQAFALVLLSRAAKLVAEIEKAGISNDDMNVKSTEQTDISNDDLAHKRLSAWAYMYCCAEVVKQNLFVFGQDTLPVKVQRLPDLNSNLNLDESSTHTKTEPPSDGFEDTLPVKVLCLPYLNSNLNSDESSTHTKTEPPSDDFYDTISNLLDELKNNLDKASMLLEIPIQLTTIALDVVIKDINTVVDHYKKQASVQSAKMVKKIETKSVAIGLGYTAEIHDVEIVEQKSNDRPEPHAPHAILDRPEPRAPHAILDHQEEGQQTQPIHRSFSGRIMQAIKHRHTNM